MPLRQWMRKHEIYDKDLEELMTEDGITEPDEDFKTYTQEQWNELYRKARVERFKELKDQTARSRLQKKLDKLEKLWRGISGIKKTVGKASKGKKNKPSKSKEKKESALKSAPALKKYMQKNEIWETELYQQLVESGVTCEEDIIKIDSQDAFDEIIRLVKVARVSELKDQTSRSRLEKKLSKWEKIWRQKTGIKKTMQSKSKGKSKGKSKAKPPKDKEISKMQSEGRALKTWLQKNNIWEKELWNECLKLGVRDEEGLKNVDQEQFDELVRKVRVQRFTELKDQTSRNRLDKKLVAFEKLWRQKSGIKKTMQN